MAFSGRNCQKSFLPLDYPFVSVALFLFRFAYHFLNAERGEGQKGVAGRAMAPQSDGTELALCAYPFLKRLCFREE